MKFYAITEETFISSTFTRYNSFVGILQIKFKIFLNFHILQ